MLTQLTIRNFGLIDDLSLDFSKQLTILTGETGAGKSIIIGALRYVLGERLQGSHIRNRNETCTAEAVFTLSTATLEESPLFSEYITDDDPTLIITRQTLPDGRNKIKINGMSITVATLKEIGNHLIDFHGPHDHQMLLAQESHIRIIDRLSKIDPELATYEKYYNEYLATKKEIADINKSRTTRERDLDILSYQINELEQVPLDEKKHDEIMSEYTRLAHTEKLFKETSAVLNLINKDETGIAEMISEAFSSIRTITAIDESTTRFHELLSELQNSADTLAGELESYAETLSFEPEEAKSLTTMCDIYHDMKRKYGPTITDAQKTYTEAKEKYDLLINLEHNDTELHAKLGTLEKELERVAVTISTKRKKAAASLQKTIEQELKDLGIKHVRFESRFDKIALRNDGHDDITFFISPNAGEPLKPLAEIVSSGEAARLMLALKKALIHVDPIPVLIFDEVDAQIGGRLGTVIGKKLKEISALRQVLLITHLPQIAAFAHTHFHVSKQVVDNHTEVTVTELTEDTRLEELAHMMSGDKKSGISLDHAREMIQTAQK